MDCEESIMLLEKSQRRFRSRGTGGHAHEVERTSFMAAFAPKRSMLSFGGFRLL